METNLENRVETLERKVENLERKTRVYRVLLILALLPTLWLTLSATNDGVKELVVAREFWMVDEKGEPIISLTTNPDGEPMVIVGNMTGANAKAVLYSDGDSAHLGLFDPAGNLRSRVDTDGSMTLFSKSGISFRYPLQLKGDW